MTRIKFCGLTRTADAAYAETLGASYAGVILAESPRQVSPDEARSVLAAAPRLRGVGVFRHSPAVEILEAAAVAGVEILQLHGRFSIDDMTLLREGFDGEIWTVVPVDSANPRMPDGWTDLADFPDAIVLDTSVAGASGGTGTPFDWQAVSDSVREVASRTTLILAGGLNAQNVALAIRILGPAVVDVSSGVESSAGIKDHALMRSFADAVRSASL